MYFRHLSHTISNDQNKLMAVWVIRRRLKVKGQCKDPQRFRTGGEQKYRVSERQIERLIFGRTLRNDVDERGHYASRLVARR